MEISSTGGGTVQLEDCTFSSNGAVDGGAMYVAIFERVTRSTPDLDGHMETEREHVPM